MADKSERAGEARRGYRSGYYSRRLTTRVGTPELRVLRDREGTKGALTKSHKNHPFAELALQLHRS